MIPALMMEGKERHQAITVKNKDLYIQTVSSLYASFRPVFINERDVLDM